MIKHVTSPDMFRLEQGPDSVGPLLSEVFECVPGLRDVNKLASNAALESQSLCCCCLSLRTEFSLLVSGPMFSRRSADSNFPALSVPLRRLAVGGGLAIPQLVCFSSGVDCIHSV